MAKKPVSTDSADGAEAAPDVPSTLDASTHGEMLMMYNECALAIRFAKSQQWKSMGGVLILFIVLGLYAAVADNYVTALKCDLALSLLVSIGGIYALVIYQAWQGTERQKLVYISTRLSSTFRTVREFTNPREADFHRYVLLFFMMFSILAGNWLLVLFVLPKLQALTP
jgi:hypothetical protein